jgi:alcohol dehydrogenase YqhD (iron-dependent ADH family)
VSQFGVKKFARFAQNVWGIAADGKTDEQLACEGIAALEAWMKDIGVVMHAGELGVTAENLEAIADSTIIFDAGYHKLTRDEVIQILKESI